jgi:hypothetical protein
MAYRYAITGPPFNFLGNLSETQRNAFSAWVTKQTPSLPSVQVFHQVRAQQLRKTAGLLETFYAKSSAIPDNLAPTFIKNSWTPGPDGHFPYAQRNDHVPAMVVSNIKKHFHTRLVHQDDAVFHMNHLRAQVEKQEDLAEYAFEGTTNVSKLMDKLVTLFGQAEYQAALVHDISDSYQGEPRFRVHQLDQPTAYEIATRSSRSPVTS